MLTDDFSVHLQMQHRASPNVPRDLISFLISFYIYKKIYYIIFKFVEINNISRCEYVEFIENSYLQLCQDVQKIQVNLLKLFLFISNA